MKTNLRLSFGLIVGDVSDIAVAARCVGDTAQRGKPLVISPASATGVAL